jgi:hypothetical protein
MPTLLHPFFKHPAEPLIVTAMFPFFNPINSVRDFFKRCVFFQSDERLDWFAGALTWALIITVALILYVLI